MAKPSIDMIRSLHDGRYEFRPKVRRVLRYMFPSLRAGGIDRLSKSKDVFSPLPPDRNCKRAKDSPIRLISPAAMRVWLSVHGDAASQERWELEIAVYIIASAT